MLPIDLILLRHGQSEGNVAIKASEKGNNRFFTPEFRDKHSRDFRLTELGKKQARAAGSWLKTNVPMPLDRFYVSDYIRAKETAAYLDLPNAEWRVEFHLRERDTALMDNIPDDEKRRLFELENRQYKINPFLSYPAGGGESIAALCLREKATMIPHWARECSDKRIIVVCHGHVMRVLQLEFENLGHDDFVRLDSSDNPADKLRNCQIVWYTRRDPSNNEVKEKLVAVRSVCPFVYPSGIVEDWGWRYIQRHRYTNQELLDEVQRYPRHIR